MAMVAAVQAGDEDKMHRIYQYYLPLIVLEQQPGVGTRKTIYQARGLLAVSCVAHQPVLP
eukprot:SAG31_NODE_23505_length_503_cov_0.638614_2_plen_59_part_01